MKWEPGTGVHDLDYQIPFRFNGRIDKDRIAAPVLNKMIECGMAP